MSDKISLEDIEKHRQETDKQVKEILDKKFKLDNAELIRAEQPSVNVLRRITFTKKILSSLTGYSISKRNAKEIQHDLDILHYHICGGYIILKPIMKGDKK